MKRLLIACLFLFVQFLLSSVVAQNRGIIKGRIVDVQNNNPIPFCNIAIDGTELSTQSDIDGKFKFVGVAPGYQRLTIFADGFRPYTSQSEFVTNNKESYFAIELEKIPINIEEITVRPNTFRQREDAPLSLRTIPIREIEQNPGGNRDISKVIQSYPGVAASPVGFRNDLIVRGGGPSENRFYVDGVEIPTINHFSTQGASGGPIGILNIDFIREVDFYSGAYPASRGNGLSSILRFKQKDGNPDVMKYRAAVGSSDLALSAEGPLGKRTTGFLSYRLSYLQLLFDLLDQPFLPTYNDIQFKVKTKFDEKNELIFLGLGSLDDMELNLDANDDEEQELVLDYLPTIKQFSFTLGAVYKRYRDQSYDTWVLSTNRLDNRETKYLNNIERPENLLRDYNSWEMETKFRYEYNRRNNDGFQYTLGGGLEWDQYFNETFRLDFIDGDPTEINYQSDIDFLEYSLFGQATRRYLEERLTLTAGLRFDGNSFSSDMSNPLEQIAPRVSCQYQLSNDWNTTFSVGRYAQLPPYTSMGYRDNNGVLVNKNNGIQYIKSNQVGLGIDYSPNDESFYSFELFYKGYNDYPFSITDSVSMASKGANYGAIGDEPVFSNNKGRSYGAELSLRNNDFYGFATNLSYTIVRSEFKNSLGNYIPSAWDNKHLLTLTVLKELRRNWDFGFKFRFLGGAPYTPYDVETSSLKEAWDAQRRGYLDYSEFNQKRLDAYHQLDVRADKAWYFNKWTLRLYIDIQNLYGKAADQPEELTLVRDENGNPLTDPTDPDRYVLKYIDVSDSSFLPTIGVMIDF